MWWQSIISTQWLPAALTGSRPRWGYRISPPAPSSSSFLEVATRFLQEKRATMAMKRKTLPSPLHLVCWMTRAAWARGVPVQGNGSASAINPPTGRPDTCSRKAVSISTPAGGPPPAGLHRALVRAHHTWISPYLRSPDVTPSARCLMSVSGPS